MNVVVKYSVILAAAVIVVSALLYASGLHANPALGGLLSIGLFILFNVGAIYLALAQTAGENGYGKQLFNAAGVGLLAGALIFLGSWLLLAVVFPDALAEMKDGYIEMLQAAGQSEQQIDAVVQQFDKATPISQSVPALIGTFITSLVVGAIVAIFKRKK